MVLADLLVHAILPQRFPWGLDRQPVKPGSLHPPQIKTPCLLHTATWHKYESVPPMKVRWSSQNMGTLLDIIQEVRWKAHQSPIHVVARITKALYMIMVLNQWLPFSTQPVLPYPTSSPDWVNPLTFRTFLSWVENDTHSDTHHTLLHSELRIRCMFKPLDF